MCKGRSFTVGVLTFLQRHESILRCDAAGDPVSWMVNLISSAQGSTRTILLESMAFLGRFDLAQIAADLTEEKK